VREPEGNGVAERFIRTLKENLLWVRTFDTIEELRTALVEFATRYNETRLVARHGYRTPGSAECLKTGPRDDLEGATTVLAAPRQVARIGAPGRTRTSAMLPPPDFEKDRYSRHVVPSRAMWVQNMPATSASVPHA
jgi:hypothetical protein